MSHLELVTAVVRDYDTAIRFFVDVLQFELVEDSPSLTNDGRPKRWVVVRPAGGQTGVLLARGGRRAAASVVGLQFGGRGGRHVPARRRFRVSPSAHGHRRCPVRLAATARTSSPPGFATTSSRPTCPGTTCCSGAWSRWLGLEGWRTNVARVREEQPSPRSRHVPAPRTRGREPHERQRDTNPATSSAPMKTT